MSDAEKSGVDEEFISEVKPKLFEAIYKGLRVQLRQGIVVLEEDLDEEAIEAFGGANGLKKLYAKAFLDSSQRLLDDVNNGRI